jgi:hypothetical protein
MAEAKDTFCQLTEAKSYNKNFDTHISWVVIPRHEEYSGTKRNNGNWPNGRLD